MVLDVQIKLGAIEVLHKQNFNHFNPPHPTFSKNKHNYYRLTYFRVRASKEQHLLWGIPEHDFCFRA